MPSGVIERSRNGRFLLLHPSLPRFAVVNETGKFIASLCDGENTVAQIIKATAGHYGIDQGRVSSDVELFLEQLDVSGMLNSPATAQRVVEARTVKRIHLTITGRCNLRCSHCGAVRVLNAEDQLSTADVKGIIDQLEGKPEASIAITGGEPFLRNDLVEVVRYSSDRIKTIVSTNASLITVETAKELAPLPVTFQVSLDGATAPVHDAFRGKGTFDAALKGIRLLQDHGAGRRVELCRTVMGRPDEDLREFVDFGESLGVGGIRLLCLARLGRAEEKYDELNPTLEHYRKFYREYYRVIAKSDMEVVVGGGIPGLFLDVPEDAMWCHIGEMLEVGPKGRIYPCSILADPKFDIGSVWDMTLQSAAECDKMMELHALFDSRTEKIEKCRSCPFKNFCQGGCPGMALSEKGTFLSEDNLCELRRELFEEVLFDILPAMSKQKMLVADEIVI